METLKVKRLIIIPIKLKLVKSFIYSNLQQLHRYSFHDGTWNKPYFYLRCKNFSLNLYTQFREFSYIREKIEPEGVDQYTGLPYQSPHLLLNTDLISIETSLTSRFSYLDFKRLTIHSTMLHRLLQELRFCTSIISDINLITVGYFKFHNL